MKLTSKIERALGWIAIENLPLYIVTAQAVIYVWLLVNPESASSLILSPRAVVYGREYWRLLTFLFVTPVQNPIFAFFFLYLLYIYGMALEQEWGSYHFTLFYLVGALGTTAAAFFFGSRDGAFYLNTSIFLAFAAIHPNFQLLLFFIIPVKIKWLAWVAWVYFAYVLWHSPTWAKMSMLVSLVNYFLFFGHHHFMYIVDAARRYQHKKRYKDFLDK